MKKIKLFFKVYLAVLFLFTAFLYGEKTNLSLKATNEQKAFSKYSHRKPFLSFSSKNKKIFFTNEINFITYYRNSILFEITGNEQTFGVFINNDLTFHYDLHPKIRFSLFLDVDFYQPISGKSRNFDSLSPPLFRAKEASLEMIFNKSHHVKMGIMPSFIYNFPIDSIFPPVLFSLSTTDNQRDPSFVTNIQGNPEHTLLLGERDLPIMYSGLIPRHDTGISYEWIHSSGFLSALGVYNGEGGLDPNSAKTVMAKIGFKNRHLDTAITTSIGNIGSIPIKEKRHIYKFHFFGGGDVPRGGSWKIGLDSLFILHGIRDSRFSLSNQAAAGYYFYGPNYYSTFSLTVPEGREELYGLSAYFFFQIEGLANKRVFIDGHLGLYDPDLLIEDNHLYQIKYRTFIRLKVRIIDEFYIVLSDTYTHDPVFFNQSTLQFWQRETYANNLHIMLDMDIFVGLLYKI